MEVFRPSINGGLTRGVDWGRESKNGQYRLFLPMACLAEFTSAVPSWDNCSERKSELQRQKTDVGWSWGGTELIVPASGFRELLCYSKLVCLVKAPSKRL